MAPEQVQDFSPTPSTISTCMYYTGLERAACCRDSRSEERENRKPPLFVFVRVNGKIGSAFTEDLVVDSVVLGEEGDVVVAQAIVSAILSSSFTTWPMPNVAMANLPSCSLALLSVHHSRCSALQRENVVAVGVALWARAGVAA